MALIVPLLSSPNLRPWAFGGEGGGGVE